MKVCYTCFIFIRKEDEEEGMTKKFIYEIGYNQYEDGYTQYFKHEKRYTEEEIVEILKKYIK